MDSSKPINEMLHLIWDNHFENITSLFKTLYEDSSLVDVTLLCQDGDIKAHKLVLSACSPYFQRVFNENPHPHPLVILRGVKHCEMSCLVDFMYRGMIDVPASLFVNLMHIANDLEIKGFKHFSNRPDSDHESANSITVETVKVTQGLASKKQDQRASAQNVNNHVRKRLTDYSCSYSDEEGSLSSNKTRKMDEYSINSGDEISKDVTITTLKKKPEVELLLKKGASSSKSFSHHDNIDLEEVIDATTISENYLCSLCSRNFRRKEQLHEHMNYHQQQYRSAQIKRSKLLHFAERPVSCDLCGKNYSCLEKLQSHMKLSHEVQPLSLLSLSMQTDVDNFEESDMNPTMCEAKPKEENGEQNYHEYNMFEQRRLLQTQPKRGRGRPRKYPIPASSLLPKRGRGRPRLHRINYNNSYGNPMMYHQNNRNYVQNYDITNLPFGDLNYLTMPEDPREMTGRYGDMQRRQVEAHQKVNLKINAPQMLVNRKDQPPLPPPLQVKHERPEDENVVITIEEEDKEEVNPEEKQETGYTEDRAEDDEEDDASSNPAELLEPVVEITADDTTVIPPQEMQEDDKRSEDNQEMEENSNSNSSQATVTHFGECTMISLAGRNTFPHHCRCLSVCINNGINKCYAALRRN